MTISSGPLPLVPVQPNGDLPSFHLNQHITAVVLQVNDVQAVLLMEGVPIVARLTSAEQGATLQSNRLANFIVKDINGQQLLLQIAPADQKSALALPNPGQDLAASLLEQSGIPLTDKNLILARSLIGSGLELNSQILSELTHTLDQTGGWGDLEARISTALKAAGLPVTEGSLALVLRGDTNLTQSLVDLVKMMNNAAQRPQNPELGELLSRAMAALNDTVLDWKAPPDKLAESLRQASAFLGQSLEHLLLDQARNPEQALPAKSLMLLAELKQALETHGDSKLATAIGSFLEDVRQSHLLNLQPQPVPGQGQWSRLDLALHLVTPPTDPNGRPGEEFQQARIRIAHDDSRPDHRIDPAYTRLVIQVDLQPGSTIQVDLSVVNHQVKAEVTAPDTATREWAKSELPGLADGLAGLGYNLQKSEVNVGPIDVPLFAPSVSRTPISWKAIDLEA